MLSSMVVGSTGGSTSCLEADLLRGWGRQVFQLCAFLCKCLCLRCKLPDSYISSLARSESHSILIESRRDQDEESVKPLSFTAAGSGSMPSTAQNPPEHSLMPPKIAGWIPPSQNGSEEWNDSTVIVHLALYLADPGLNSGISYSSRAHYKWFLNTEPGIQSRNILYK